MSCTCHPALGQDWLCLSGLAVTSVQGRHCYETNMVRCRACAQVYIYVGPGMAPIVNNDKVQALTHQMERDLSQGQLMQALQVKPCLTSWEGDDREPMKELARHVQCRLVQSHRSQTAAVRMSGDLPAACTQWHHAEGDRLGASLFQSFALAAMSELCMPTTTNIETALPVICNLPASA